MEREDMKTVQEQGLGRDEVEEGIRSQHGRSYLKIWILS